MPIDSKVLVEPGQEVVAGQDLLAKVTVPPLMSSHALAIHLMNLNEQERRAYLEAMGIDVWVPRDELSTTSVARAAAVADAGLLGWDELRARPSPACTRCELARDPDADGIRRWQPERGLDDHRRGAGRGGGSPR